MSVNNIIFCTRHLLSLSNSHLDWRHFSFKTSEGMGETKKVPGYRQKVILSRTVLSGLYLSLFLLFLPI